MRSVAVGLALLAFTACRDAGDTQLAKVKTQYVALLEVGTPAQSRDFEALLHELAEIPSGSHARPEADRLRQAIEAARGSVVQRPLAVAPAPLPELGAPELQARLESTRAECARLAQELSGKNGDDRKRQLEVLDACRRRADALVDSIEHVDAPDGGAR